MYKLINDYGKKHLPFTDDFQISHVLSKFYNQNQKENFNVLKHTHFIPTIEELNVCDKHNNILRYHIFNYHVLIQLSFLIDNIDNFNSITFESKTLGIKNIITTESILLYDMFYEKIIFKNNNGYFVKLPFWFSRDINFYFILYLSHHEITVKLNSLRAGG